MSALQGERKSRRRRRRRRERRGRRKRGERERGGGRGERRCKGKSTGKLMA